jgi:hypothetical protein
MARAKSKRARARGLYSRLRAILFMLVIEWTSAQCVPRTTQWRLLISQEYNPWEAYVKEFNAYEGTLALGVRVRATLSRRWMAGGESLGKGPCKVKVRRR